VYAPAGTEAACRSAAQGARPAPPAATRWATAKRKGGCRPTTQTNWRCRPAGDNQRRQPPTAHDQATWGSPVPCPTNALPPVKPPAIQTVQKCPQLPATPFQARSITANRPKTGVNLVRVCFCRGVHLGSVRRFKIQSSQSSCPERIVTDAHTKRPLISPREDPLGLPSNSGKHGRKGLDKGFHGYPTR
jgi:hypothetical protein